LPPVVQQQLLYLFQEALNNVAKHAGAQQVDICLSWTEDTLTAALADDGCGFDVADMEWAPGHYGLRIMQERAEEINGQLTISSRPGRGTQLLLQLPLTNDHPRGTER
jgi:signal transduction histidine kinase